MRVTEISYKGMHRSEDLDAYIQERADHLEKIARGIVTCRVAVEVAQKNHRMGNPYRMRVEINVPPGHDLVAVKERTDEELPHGLRTLAREVFDALEQQVRKAAAKRRGETKSHETDEQPPMALVVRVFRDKGYGFIKTVEGEEYYFHKNSVLHDDFERLKIGTEVRFAEELGREGPQASSVQIVNKRGGQ